CPVSRTARVCPVSRTGPGSPAVRPLRGCRAAPCTCPPTWADPPERPGHTGLVARGRGRGGRALPQYAAAAPARASRWAGSRTRRGGYPRPFLTSRTRRGGRVTATVTAHLSDTDLATVDRYWRAANYLAVGQIYLLDNPLLSEPLTA